MRRELARMLPNLVFVALLLGGEWLLDIHSPPHTTVVTEVTFVVWILAASVAGTVVHELGHLLAARLVGAQVLGLQIGGQAVRVQWNVGSVAVSVGLGLGGEVSFRGKGLPAGRRAVVAAAGPAASLLFAPLCLLLPVPRWEAAVLVLCSLATALQNLVPGRTADGQSTDGGALWRTRARLRSGAQVRALLAGPDWQDRPDAVGILINGFRQDVAEAEDCLRELTSQPESLLRVFARPWTLPDKPEPDCTHLVNVLSWKVLVTGDLPATMADLAASRAQWVIDHLGDHAPDERTPLYCAQSTLALARFRQGRPGEARQLCTGALAAESDPHERASLLATVAMARHAGLLSGRPQLDEALALDPQAPLVSEAARFLSGGWDTALAGQPA